MMEGMVTTNSHDTSPNILEHWNLPEVWPMVSTCPSLVSAQLMPTAIASSEDGMLLCHGVPAMAFQAHNTNWNMHGSCTGIKAVCGGV